MTTSAVWLSRTRQGTRRLRVPPAAGRRRDQLLDRALIVGLRNEGDVVQVHERSRPMTPFLTAAAGAHVGSGPTAPYLDVSISNLTARVLRDPVRAEVPVICNEQLVVEFYSR